MHRSGITVNDELRAAFESAQGDDSVGFLRLGIADEAFVVVSRGGAQGSAAGNFDAAAADMPAEEPSYVLVKDGAGKWVMVNFVPPDAQVKQKMLFASSRADLKEGLGAQLFTEDFFISEKGEMSHAEYEASLRSHDSAELMTADERVKQDAHQSSMREMGGGSTQSAISDLPIKVDASASGALASFKDGKAQAVVLEVDPEKELLSGTESKDASPEGLAGALKPDDPQYVLFRFAHEHQGKKSSAPVFLYYCPDSAKPRAKMMSATFRSMVVRIVEDAGVADAKSMEISDPRELTAAAVQTMLHPAEVVEKKFSKPSRPGKPARRRMHGNVKFQG